MLELWAGRAGGASWLCPTVVDKRPSAKLTVTKMMPGNNHETLDQVEAF